MTASWCWIRGDRFEDMNSRQRAGVSLTALLLLAVTSAVEVRWWFQARESARRALAALGQAKAERQGLSRMSPAPNERDEEAIGNDLERARAAADGIRVALAGPRESVDPDGRASAKPIDVYFEIAAFVETLRARATQAGVAVKPDERFGFASHAHEGPTLDRVAAVRRQCAEAEFLLETLIEARPRAVLGVQRERPSAPARRVGRFQSVGSDQSSGAEPPDNDGVAEDFFALDPKLSVRRSGLVDSDAFRLAFTGQTRSLRVLLNEFASSPWPVVVRCVEVQRVPPERGSAVPPAAGAEVPRPLVASNLSRFAVVVEVIRFPVAATTPTS